MGFGSPWILWALSAIAIPIIIHLFYFRRYKKIYFSSIQFLKEAAVEQKKTGKLKNLLILISRILALIFLALAFALPFIGDKNSANISSDNLLIYIDNTFSMSYIDNNRTLLDEAKNIAKNILDGMDKEGKVMILTHDSEGGQKSFYPVEEAKKLIEDIQFTSSVRNMSDWNRQTQQLLQDIHVQDVRAIYISDFQNYALPEKWDSVCPHTTLVPVLKKERYNVVIDSVFLLDPIVYKGASNQFVLQVSNQGPERDSKIHLYIQGDLAGVHEIHLPENSSITDTVAFFIKDNQWIKGKLTIEDAQLEFDNTLYFSLEPPKNNKVLLLEEVQSSSAVFQVFKSDPGVTVHRQNPQNAAVTEDYSLIVLNELSALSSELQENLTEYVQSGGNLYVIPHEKNAPSAYNKLLSDLSVGQYAEKKTQHLTVTEMNAQEPVISIAFEHIPEHVDLPEVYAYWTITSSYQVPEYSILKFENGRSFLQKYQLDRGIVYLQASGLHASSGNFSTKTVFAPIVYNLALIRSENSPLYYTMGKKQVLSGLKTSGISKDVFKLTSGQYEIIPSVYPMGQVTGIEVPAFMNRDGWYDILRNDEKVSEIACNYSRLESEMKFASKEELATRYDEPYLEVLSSNELIRKNSGGIFNGNRRLWKVCVILALLFLTIEIVLIRIFNKSSADEI